MNRTFRITKNTFEIRNAYGSIDTRRRPIHAKKSDEDESLRNVLNSITLKRGSRRNHQYAL